METGYMGNLSTEQFIYSVVCDRDFVLLLSDQCIAGAYLGIFQIHVIYFIRNGIYHNFCLYFVFYDGRSIGFDV